jgi:AraC-like DNA-binding protein
MLVSVGVNLAYSRRKLVNLVSTLVSQLPGLTASEVSAKLHVHRHTLRRALKANGQTFTSIKQAAILERLTHHFDKTEPTPMKQIWTELGFVSASAFARYIRRATGKSPSELRGDRTVAGSKCC